MTVINPVPRVRFQQTSATRPRLTNAFKTGVFAGCSDDDVNGPLLAPEVYNSGAKIRAIFGECSFTRMAENHFAMDPERTPVIIVRVPTTTPGVLHVDASTLVGTSVVTADGTVTPLGDFEPYIEIAVGGTVGVAGIVLLVSLDNGRKTPLRRVELGTAMTLDLGGGCKFNFTAATLDSGIKIGRAHV